MIQHSTFSTGGFVLHKIMIGKQKYSAWYGQNGQLLDAQMVKGDKTRSVGENHTNIRRELTITRARRWRKKHSIPSITISRGRKTDGTNGIKRQPQKRP